MFKLKYWFGKTRRKGFFTYYGECVHSILYVSPHFQTSPSRRCKTFLSFLYSANSLIRWSVVTFRSLRRFVRAVHLALSAARVDFLISSSNGEGARFEPFDSAFFLI